MTEHLLTGMFVGYVAIMAGQWIYFHRKMRRHQALWERLVEERRRIKGE